MKKISPSAYNIFWKQNYIPAEGLILVMESASLKHTISSIQRDECVCRILYTIEQFCNSICQI